MSIISKAEVTLQSTLFSNSEWEIIYPNQILKLLIIQKLASILLDVICTSITKSTRQCLSGKSSHLTRATRF